MAGSRIFSRLKSIDFYRKLPTDLTEATLTGAWISITAAVVMAFLFGMEFYAFVSTSTTTSLIVDRSAATDLLKINFNVSFPALSCEFAAVDVSDALGTRRLNITKTIRKTSITDNLEMVGRSKDASITRVHKYDEVGRFDDSDIDVTQPINHFNFKQTLARYPIVVVNFFAPWCHWCQRLEPTWEQVTKEIHDKYPESDGRIRFAKVDCTAEVDLCRAHFITGFPSIRVFRNSHDDITIGGRHEHEAYQGDRTRESFLTFADALVASEGKMDHPDLEAAVQTKGCNMAGFVLVKKVPGTLHFAARSDSHTFDHSWMNMTHVVHGLNFGSRPSVRKYQLLKRLHPAGLEKEWADKLHSQSFVSDHPQSTHEHYLQVVLTTVSPRSKRAALSYDAYEYTAHSHTFMSDDIPSAKVTFDLSPIQILVQETSKPLYHFLTTTCAIVGGVFTVAGILDAILYQSVKLMKKNQLGKQG